MRFLDTLDLYLTEADDSVKFKLVPVDFDEEHAYSFSVEEGGEEVAKISIKTLDGKPIDALSAPYNYDEVYADVQMEADEDNPRTLPLMEWIKDKLDNMGYDENPIRLNNDEHHMDDEGDDRGVDAEEENLPDSRSEYEYEWNDSTDGDEGNDEEESDEEEVDAESEFDTDSEPADAEDETDSVEDEEEEAEDGDSGDKKVKEK